MTLEQKILDAFERLGVTLVKGAARRQSPADLARDVAAILTATATCACGATYLPDAKYLDHCDLCVIRQKV